MLAAVVGMMLVAAPVTLWPHPEKVKVFTELAGHFDASPVDLTNHLNEPKDAPPRPPPLAVSPEVLAALNGALPAALAAAVKDVGFVPAPAAERAAAQKSARPLTGGPEDHALLLQAQVAGGTAQGGTYGGLTVRLTLTSLHRAVDLAGGASLQVPVPASPEQASAALRAVLAAGVTQAVNDFKGHLDDEAQRPRAKVRLAVALDGLTPEQRDHATGPLLQCMAGLAAPLSTAPEVAAGERAQLVLEVRLRRYDPAETAASFTQALADQLRFEVRSHGKARCSLFFSPLKGMESVVEADPDSASILVRLRPTAEP
jgi:hypothetical protein